MENDDTKDGSERNFKELKPSVSKVQPNSKPNRNQRSTSKFTKPKKKKWSLVRHWRAATRKQQLKWVAEGLGVLIALCVLGTYIWGNLQTMWNFQAEHRPKVIISRPPDLRAPVNCEVTDERMEVIAHGAYVWVKNIRPADAAGAFASPIALKLVPASKIGIPFFDDIPTVNEETCRRPLQPALKLFPIHGHEEVRVDISGEVSTSSLTKTGDDGQIIKAPITKDTMFNLYLPVCVRYSDGNGTSYTSCRNYRLVLQGADGNTSNFSCSQSPIAGRFEEVLSDYCEN